MDIRELFDTSLLWDGMGEPPASDDVIHDWVGNRWPQDSFPILPDPGWRGPEVPVHGDGFRAGPYEWGALAIAARYAQEGSRPAVLVEMGASQAPWCLSWIRTHLKLKTAARVRAVGYEAGDGAEATERFWGAQDLAFDVTRGPGVLRCTGSSWQFEWKNLAVAVGGGTMYFPDIDIRTDNGAQAVSEAQSEDYRGAPVTYRQVSAIDPVQAVVSEGFVHLLHMDLQGGELDAMRAGFFDQVGDVVGVVLLGTHSRTAEGLAFELMFDAGFHLLCEEPCGYMLVDGVPRLCRDGEQLWVSGDVFTYLTDRRMLREPFRG